MINPQTPVLRGVLVLAASLLAHACGTDTVRCPPSQALFEGRCVDFEDTDEGLRRPADAGDTEDNGGPDSQTDVPGTGDGGCDGVAPVCDGADTVVECGSDGELVRRLCEDGSSCSGGQCLGDGQICEPGAVTGCATPASYLECNAEGTATDERPVARSP